MSLLGLSPARQRLLQSRRGTSRVISVQIDGALTTSSQIAVVAPEDGDYRSCKVAVGTAPVGAALLVDLHKNGTTLFTTQASRITVADGASSGAEVATPDITHIAEGDVLLFDVDQVGSGTAGSDAVFTLIYDAK